MQESRARMALFPVALTLTLSAIDIFQGAFWDAGKSTVLERLDRSAPPWLIAAALLPLARSLLRIVPLDLRPWPLAVHLAASLVWSLLHTVLIASYNMLRIHDMSWPALFQRSLFWNLASMVTLYFLYAGALAILENTRALRRQEQDALELKASLAEARLAGLRAQLNPHFLYNVLNTAAMLAREQRTSETVSVLARLGDLLRYVLRESSAGESELREEVDFLRRYLDLERIRFADRLQVTFDVDPSIERMRVPSLLLQPLVENAVHHGISQKPGTGNISIRAQRTGANIELEVRDDGPGLSGHSDGAGVGVRNTRDRLSTRYGAAARLTVGAAPGGGTVAVVTIPFEEAA